MPKAYFEFIRILQEALLSISIVVLVALPPLLAYGSEFLPTNLYSILFTVSLSAVTLVMAVRPLADLFPRTLWPRPLVILRKGVGVLSASIIVAIMLSHVMVDGIGYFSRFADPVTWSIAGGAILAPLGDLSALVLLITSNQFSKRVLGKHWKRIQRLSYVYFYAGALYEVILYGSAFALVSMIIVTILVAAAWLQKRLSPARLAPL